MTSRRAPVCSAHTMAARPGARSALRTPAISDASGYTRAMPTSCWRLQSVIFSGLIRSAACSAPLTAAAPGRTCLRSTTVRARSTWPQTPPIPRRWSRRAGRRGNIPGKVITSAWPAAAAASIYRRMAASAGTGLQERAGPPGRWAASASPRREPTTDCGSTPPWTRKKPAACIARMMAGPPGSGSTTKRRSPAITPAASRSRPTIRTWCTPSASRSAAVAMAAGTARSSRVLPAAMTITSCGSIRCIPITWPRRATKAPPSLSTAA